MDQLCLGVPGYGSRTVKRLLRACSLTLRIFNYIETLKFILV